jgi:hypothetical protein
MAGSISDYLELKMLDGVLGGTNFTQPATVYLALFTAAPSDSGGGTEVSGGSYARLAVTNNATNFPAASGTTATKTLNTTQTFVTPTGSWGLVTHFGIFDALTVGNLLFWASLTASQTISSGNTVSFAAGALSITLD